MKALAGNLLLILAACTPSPEPLSGPQAVIAYVAGFRGVVDPELIDADKITHINYAFVDVKDSVAWLHHDSTDTVNFRKLHSLKSKKADLKLLISIGGWSWSENFSDAVLTKSSREKFALSAVEIVRQHDLDGIDIDWEYPGMRGEDNVFRPEDKQNFTLMFKAMREKLDVLAQESRKSYLLTTAVGGFQECINHVEMDQTAQYLDYVNIMTYDFYTSGDSAGHHTNLYSSESKNELSTDRAVREYIQAGVPANKLVIGIAFYGRSWIMQSADNNGLNRPVKEVLEGAGYSFIRDSLADQKGLTRHWDDKAKAPYLFNSQTNQLVSYDDEESVKHKCDYVKSNGLAGVMFWEYSSDPKEYLLGAIHENLHKVKDQ